MTRDLGRPASHLLSVGWACREGQTSSEDNGINHSAPQTTAEWQFAEAVAAERESLSWECRADATRVESVFASDFHEFGTGGG